MSFSQEELEVLQRAADILRIHEVATQGLLAPLSLANLAQSAAPNTSALQSLCSTSDGHALQLSGPSGGLESTVQDFVNSTRPSWSNSGVRHFGEVGDAAIDSQAYVPFQCDFGVLPNLGGIWETTGLYETSLEGNSTTPLFSSAYTPHQGQPSWISSSGSQRDVLETSELSRQKTGTAPPPLAVVRFTECQSGSPPNSAHAQPFRDVPHQAQKRKGKRNPYPEKEKRNTKLTRQLRGCIRCRLNRKRCEPDDSNPRGPCRNCQNLVYNVVGLPCLRYLITDSRLFRTGTNTSFYRRHPMIGDDYGDFRFHKSWISPTTKTIDLTQDRGTILHLEVRKFDPPLELDATDTKGFQRNGRNIYAIPWAIASEDKGMSSVRKFFGESVGQYLDSGLQDTNPLVHNVFKMALAMASNATPNLLLQDVLHLWAASRFIDGGWRCCGEETLDAEYLHNPCRPTNWISPPPYLSYQMGSIFMECLLRPLQSRVLRRLNKTVLAERANNFFVIFLTCFIILHNYEVSMEGYYRHAQKRNVNERYLDMELVEATYSGANRILAHFHHVCKGNRPFQPDFDWNEPTVQRMAELDVEQLHFMRNYQQEVIDQGEANQAQHDWQRFWFTSQLFEPDWRPRSVY